MGSLSPNHYVPRHHRDLHKRMGRLRNEVYAHIDKSSPRSATYEVSEEDVALSVSAFHFPVGRLDELIVMTTALAERCVVEAALHVDLAEDVGVGERD